MSGLRLMVQRQIEVPPKCLARSLKSGGSRSTCSIQLPGESSRPEARGSAANFGSFSTSCAAAAYNCQTAQFRFNIVVCPRKYLFC